MPNKPRCSEMDSYDRKILDLLQQDATLSVSEIADVVGLSRTPCWRRIQNLERSGVLTAKVALVDQQKINLGVTAFVALQTQHHDEAWLLKFTRLVEAMPEVIEFYRMSGSMDYLMKLILPNIETYDAVYKRLIGQIDLLDVEASFSMETIKKTTRLPTSYL